MQNVIPIMKQWLKLQVRRISSYRLMWIEIDLESLGNEGASMDRWYRRTCLVFWPRSKFPLALFSCGPEVAMDQLEKQMKQPAQWEDAQVSFVLSSS